MFINQPLKSFFVALFFIALGFALPAHAGWNVQVADVGGSAGRQVGKYSDLAIDADGFYHVSYVSVSASTTSNEVKYATNESGAWVTTTLESNTTYAFSYTSIAVDTNQYVHVAYGDTASGSLKYATNESGAWVTSTIDTITGASISIALDSGNKVHVSYAGTSIFYATNASGSWSARNFVDVSSSGTATYADQLKYTSIGVDSADKVHIAYFDDYFDDLLYATNESGAWVASTIDSSGYVGYYPSLDIDSGDNIHIAYCSNTKVKYATNSSGSWVTSDAASGGSSGGHTSIVLNSSDEPTIAYYYQTATSLKILSDPVTTTSTDGSGVTTTSTTWNSDTVDNNDTVGSYVFGGSMAIDAADTIALSYADTGRNDLKIATTEEVWSREVIVDTGNSGSHTSASQDGSYVSSYYQTSGDLKLSTRSLTYNSWSTASVATTGNIGQYTATTNATGFSSSSTADDYINVSYYDYTNKDLYVAQISVYSSSSVTRTAVDTGGDVGKFTSIAVDDNDYLHISYFDDTNDDLKYASNETGAWVTETVDTGSVGQFTSVDVDSSGFVHIAYHDATNRDLKYATNESGAWVTSTVDTTGNSGLYSDIVAEDDGTIHISYARNMSLGYAVYSGGSWTKTTVDSGLKTGYFTSLAVDDSGFVHIAYNDQTNRDLKYATNESGAWVKATVDNGIDGSDVGKYASIGIDADGLIRIAYYDDTSDDLRIAIEPQ